MKRLYQIRRVFTKAILFEGEYETYADCVQAACDAGIDLSRANFQAQDLSGIRARNFNFTRACFTDAVATGATFQGCGMSGIQGNLLNATAAKFHGANLTDAMLKNATLDDAEFTGAETTGIKLEGASLTGIVRDLHSGGGFEPDEG